MSELHDAERNNPGERLMGIAEGPGVDAKRVEYVDVDGLAIFEGDIILGTTADLPDGDPTELGYAIGVSDARFLWPEGVIPYDIPSRNYAPDLIRAAIRHWEDKTPLRFVQRQSEYDHLTFQKGRGCSSYVGRRGGKQPITLADWATLGTIVHEIGHALGLWHEQSRADRDQYVTVNWSNIQAGTEHNFQQHIRASIDLGPYDYDSVMHYGPSGFAIDRRKPTLIPKGGQSIGQREGLSPGDIDGVAQLYGFPTRIQVPVGKHTPEGEITGGVKTKTQPEIKTEPKTETETETETESLRARLCKKL